MPPVLLPRKGRFALTDYEKIFCPDPDRDDIYDLRGISRQSGCMVLARPDQYVASILPLDAHADLVEFFDQVLVEAPPPDSSSTRPPNSLRDPVLASAAHRTRAGDTTERIAPP